jgi:hypothetical protein
MVGFFSLMLHVLCFSLCFFFCGEGVRHVTSVTYMLLFTIVTSDVPLFLTPQSSPLLLPSQYTASSYSIMTAQSFSEGCHFLV